jgi:CHAD domain-containing protein
MQIDGTIPLWIAARTLLFERGDDFFRRRDKALKTSDPEEIHDLRVASRRLREGLALFAPCYPTGNLNRLVKQIKLVTRLLGEIRNTDEAILFFTELAEVLDESCRSDLERVLDNFQISRKKELKKLKTGLRDIVSKTVHDRFIRTVSSPSLFTQKVNSIDLFMPLSQFAGSALDSRLTTVLELLPEAGQPGAGEAQHLLRIAIKHVRYRLEILSFLIGDHYEEMHGVLKGYQDVLGKLHDLDVFTGIVQEAGFSSQAEQLVLDAMEVKKAKLFASFSGMLVTTSLETIGERLRNVW